MLRVVPGVPSPQAGPAVQVFAVMSTIARGFEDDLTLIQAPTTVDFAGDLTHTPIVWAVEIAGTAAGPDAWRVGAIAFTEGEAGAAHRQVADAYLARHTLPV